MQFTQSPLSVTPKAPALHWAVVLVLSILTLNVFGVVWMIRQAWFARQIDPPNRAVLSVGASLLLQLFMALMSFLDGLTTAKTGQSSGLAGLFHLMQWFSFVCFVSGAFQIRATLMKHYGIKLNGFLTFFLNTYYFQYHLSKIAKAQNVPFGEWRHPRKPAPLSAYGPYYLTHPFRATFLCVASSPARCNPISGNHMYTSRHSFGAEQHRDSFADNDSFRSSSAQFDQAS